MANLITKTTLVNTCGLNSLVEDRKVDIHIDEAQLRLEAVIGSTLYALLKAAFDADNTLAGSTNERFRNLLARGKGYGEDFLAWTAMHMAYPGLHSEADRSGVYTKEGDEHKPVDSRTLTMHMNGAKDRYEDRQERLITYLTNNASTYPEFNTTAPGEERITTTTGGGFILGPSPKTITYRG